MPAVSGPVGMEQQTESAAVRGLRLSNLADGGHDVPGHAQALDAVVSSGLVGDDAKRWGQPLELQRVLGLGSYVTAWTWLHKFRRAMVRPGRDRLTGHVEVDETYVGGGEEGVRGRETVGKALVVVAAEEDGRGIGRIRLRRIKDASAASLEAFVEEAIEAGSLLHTDGWEGYAGLQNKGYRHQVTVLRGKRQSASKLLPRVHRVVALLKRWLLGTHQGAVSHEYLDYYLDEFTFRFNRRTSRSRGKLFYRLLQQAVAIDPVPYKKMVEATWAETSDPKI